jgi:hypothetical protein
MGRDLRGDRTLAALARLRDIARMAHEVGVSATTGGFLEDTLAEYGDVFARVDDYEATFKRRRARVSAFSLDTRPVPE